jgi:hypothetical protein
MARVTHRDGRAEATTGLPNVSPLGPPRRAE